MTASDNKQAYVLRISPGGDDLVPEALELNQIIIGWGVPGLLSTDLEWTAFRSIISDAFFPNAQNQRAAGAAAGHIWRFIHEMREGDYVIVPHGSKFYVAEVLGEASFHENHPVVGQTYRRPVHWLNEEKPISRSSAKAALISRMKAQGTCTSASDLLPEIIDCLEVCQADRAPTFMEDLETRLVKDTLDELRSGRMDSYRFEKLICSVLLQAGASEATVVSRRLDKGADILATFLVAGTFQQIVAVQAKHWQAEPPVDSSVVEQLINGIEFSEATLGMIITSGTISDSAAKAADAYYENKGIKIELVDGEQFAKIIVEQGVGSS